MTCRAATRRRSRCASIRRCRVAGRSSDDDRSTAASYDARRRDVSARVGEFDVVGDGGGLDAACRLRSCASGGAELGYSWLDGYSVALRAGARRPLPARQPFTAGAGFTMDRLSIDYALGNAASRELPRARPRRTSACGFADAHPAPSFPLPASRHASRSHPRLVVAAACTQALKLSKDDSPTVLSHQSDRRAQPGRARQLCREDHVLRQRHRQATRRIPRFGDDQDEDGRRVAVRVDGTAQSRSRARRTGASA